MPVKKTKKRTQRSKRQDIRKAVDEIPKLIMQEMKEKETPKPPRIDNPYEAERTKRIWLWVGVSLFSLMIFAVWFLNVQQTLSTLDTVGKSEEAKIIDESTKEIKAIFDSLDKERGVQTPVDALKAAIKNALSVIPTTTPSTSTEENQSTSTQL